MPTNLQVSKIISNFAVDFRRETRNSIRKRIFCLSSLTKSGKFRKQEEEVVNQRSRFVYAALVALYTYVEHYFSFVSSCGIPEPVSGRIRNNSPRFLIVSC